MIVCVCNCLNEKKIDSAISAGASTPGKVHRANGTKVRCGRCIEYIDSMLGNRTGSASVGK